MGMVFSDIPSNTQQEMARVLLRYLMKSANVINTPGKAVTVKCDISICGLAQGHEIVTKYLETVLSRTPTPDLLHA